MENKPMKIVWLCNYSLAYLKDKIDENIEIRNMHPSTWLYYLSNEISKNSDLKLSVVILSSLVKRDYFLKENNIDFYIISDSVKRGYSYFPSKTKIFYNFLEEYLFQKITVKKIKKIIAKIDPDIINQHGTETPFKDAINYFNSPTVVWMQGLIHQVIKQEKSDSLQKMLEIEKRIFDQQKTFLTYPGNTSEIIKSINPKAEVYFVEYPISDYTFQLFNENMPKSYDVCFVGAIVKRKGVEDLIDALNIVKVKHRNLKVKIVGFTAQKEYLEYLYKKLNDYGLTNNVEFLTQINEHDEVMRHIKSSLIFVLPTHVDTGPRSVAESMAIGTPVISNNIDGVPGMIENNKTGILVGKMNIEELAGAISNLLDDEGLRKSLSINAHQEASQRWRAAAVVNELKKVYQDEIDKFYPEIAKKEDQTFEIEHS